MVSLFTKLQPSLLKSQYFYVCCKCFHAQQITVNVFLNHIQTLHADITQWSVFAIRNLCEENPANQELIVMLENQGVADTQAWLEFGCEVEIGDDGRIKVKQKNTSKRT